MLAPRIVGLEVRQLHQQLGHVARALAGYCRRPAREVDQGRIVPAARRHGIGQEHDSRGAGCGAVADMEDRLCSHCPSTASGCGSRSKAVPAVANASQTGSAA